MTDMNAVAGAVRAGNVKLVRELVAESLKEGRDAGEILGQGLAAGMERLAELFRNNEAYLPEVLTGMRAMDAGAEMLRPLLGDGKKAPRLTAVIGTVMGDMHDIGKNLVGVSLEGAGFSVADLGVDVSPERFVDAVRSRNAAVVGLSAMTTPAMESMRLTVEALAKAGLRDRVKVIVGGAPVTGEFAEKIGADGYSRDAAAAAELALKLTGKERSGM